MLDAFHYRLKAAQRDLIAFNGGIERAAEKTGYSKSQMGRCNSPTDGEHMSVAAIVALEADCGLAPVTAVLAEANGRRLTDPDAARAAHVGMMQAQADAMMQMAELVNATALAIADGLVTPTEAGTVDRIAASVEKALSELRRTLATAKAEGGAAAGLSLVSKAEG